MWWNDGMLLSCGTYGAEEDIEKPKEGWLVIEDSCTDENYHIVLFEDANDALLLMREIAKKNHRRISTYPGSWPYIDTTEPGCVDSSVFLRHASWFRG